VKRISASAFVPRANGTCARGHCSFRRREVWSLIWMVVAWSLTGEFPVLKESWRQMELCTHWQWNGFLKSIEEGSH